MLGPVLAAALASAPAPSPACEDDADHLAEVSAGILAAGPHDAEAVARARDLVRRARLSSLWPLASPDAAGADLAAAAGDTDDEARLLQIGGHARRPSSSRPSDRLVLARQAEARGDRRDAMLQYGHVLAALQRRGRPGWPVGRGAHPPARRRGRGAERPGAARIRAALRRGARGVRGRARRLLVRGAAAGGAGGVPARPAPLARLRRGRARARLARGARGTLGGGRGRVPDGPCGGPGPVRRGPRPGEPPLERTRPPGEGGVARLARPCDRAAARAAAPPARGRRPVGGLGRPRAGPRAAGRLARDRDAGRIGQATDAFREKLAASLARPAGRAGASGLPDESSPAAAPYRLAQVYAAARGRARPR